MSSDWYPEIRSHLNTCWRLVEVMRKLEPRQWFDAACHLHHNSRVEHVEHPSILHSVHVLLEPVQLYTLLCHVLVSFSSWLEVLNVLSSDINVHVNIPGYEVTKLDCPQGGARVQGVFQSKLLRDCLQ